MSQDNKNQFSSRLGLILSVLGIAVGTGNFWRFPRIAAVTASNEGSGAFIIAWAICLFSFSIPLIIAEYGIGLHGRKGVIGSFIKLIGKRYAWMGSFIALVTSGIMFYYSVITGWCIYYFLESVFAALPSNLDQTQHVWSSFQGSPLPVLFLFIVMVGGAYIVIKGISSIENINKVMIPSLFVIIIISIIRALTLPGSFEGFKFLFTPDWSQFGHFRLWLQALTQNAWSTGAGWGLILTYAAYMRSNDDITLSSFQTGFGNNIVGLLAGIIIFATVFGTLGGHMGEAQIAQTMKTSGPAGTGLTFWWMPQLFARMPGGRFFAVIFFLGLTFAAFSSLIAMIELASHVIADMGISRKKAVIGVCSVGFLVGLPSALSTAFLVNQDTVWGIGLLISGAFMAFAVIKFNPPTFRSKLVNVDENGWQLGSWWEVVIKYIVPIEVITLVGWWIYQSALVSNWYNPITEFSLMTIVVQWGVALALFAFYNHKIGDKTAETKADEVIMD
jgi:NSS family neurotransmitter:Na+ symporter